jgi:hypothetical protein
VVDRTRNVSGSCGRASSAALGVALAILCLAASSASGQAHPANPGTTGAAPSPGSGAVANFTSAINRLVELVGLAGSGILALVWARVAFSWFSNDVTKKIQAKDRARDALVGTLLFTAAVTGLVWGLAHWVITGS